MIRTQAILEVKRDERIYTLALDSASPLGECYDVINEMRTYIISRINEANQQEENKSGNEKPAE